MRDYCRKLLFVAFTITKYAQKQAEKMQRYYLDTSIWLDLFEDRNEPNFPKSDWAEKLNQKITKLLPLTDYQTGQMHLSSGIIP